MSSAIYNYYKCLKGAPTQGAAILPVVTIIPFYDESRNNYLKFKLLKNILQYPDGKQYSSINLKQHKCLTCLWTSFFKTNTRYITEDN